VTKLGAGAAGLIVGLAIGLVVGRSPPAPTPKAHPVRELPAFSPRPYVRVAVPELAKARKTFKDSSRQHPRSTAEATTAIASAADRPPQGQRCE
jgi:hypothetical protein